MNANISNSFMRSDSIVIRDTMAEMRFVVVVQTIRVHSCSFVVNESAGKLRAVLGTGSRLEPNVNPKRATASITLPPLDGPYGCRPRTAARYLNFLVDNCRIGDRVRHLRANNFSEPLAQSVKGDPQSACSQAERLGERSLALVIFFSEQECSETVELGGFAQSFLFRPRSSTVTAQRWSKSSSGVAASTGSR
jgi:hypothetical protein